MDLFSVVSSYFQGEKVEALVFILPLGLLSLVFGGWLLTEGGSFAKGVAIPCLTMGLVMSVVGGVVGFRTPAQLENLQAGLQNQKIVTLETEKARMSKVNQAWPIYLAIWGLMGVTGLILRFLIKQDFTQGLGISLVFFSGVALMIDGFAERRAAQYTEVLIKESSSVLSETK